MRCGGHEVWRWDESALRRRPSRRTRVTSGHVRRAPLLAARLHPAAIQVCVCVCLVCVWVVGVFFCLQLLYVDLSLLCVSVSPCLGVLLKTLSCASQTLALATTQSIRWCPSECVSVCVWCVYVCGLICRCTCSHLSVQGTRPLASVGRAFSLRLFSAHLNESD